MTGHQKNKYRIINAFFCTLIINALVLSVFNSLWGSGVALAASSQAESACNERVNNLAQTATSRQELLEACYYGYDEVGGVPDRIERCSNKYGTDTTRKRELYNGCTAGASAAFSDDNPLPTEKEKIKFEASDKEGQPIKGVVVSIDPSCGVTLVTTNSQGKAELDCFKGERYRASYSAPQGGTIVSKKTEDVETGKTYKIKAEINSESIDGAKEVCIDLLGEGVLQQDIDACVSGYLAAKAGEKKEDACSHYVEPFQTSCEKGYDAGENEKDNTDDNADCTANFSNPLAWIMCPVIEGIADMSDFIFDKILEPMLTQLPISTDPEDPGYKTWQGFRFLANIVLVGSMLLLVYGAARGGQ
jgi:hypothetical protein